jgi:hypothetical protein
MKSRKLKPDLKVKKKSMHGRAADMTVETAEKGDFGPIVVGNRSVDGVKEVFLGGSPT